MGQRDRRHVHSRMSAEQMGLLALASTKEKVPTLRLEMQNYRV